MDLRSYLTQAWTYHGGCYGWRRAGTSPGTRWEALVDRKDLSRIWEECHPNIHWTSLSNSLQTQIVCFGLTLQKEVRKKLLSEILTRLKSGNEEG